MGYYNANGDWISDSGMVTSAPHKAGDPANYNQTTNPGVGYDAYKAAVNAFGGGAGGAGAASDLLAGRLSGGVKPSVPQKAKPKSGVVKAYSSGSSSRRRSSGGGGRKSGGGGGGGVAKAAQTQIDAMTKLIGGGAYKVNPATYDTLRNSVNTATQQDQAAATGAYDQLDTYLQGHQTNPYANVTMTHAAQAPSYNPYLQSQGIAGSAPMASNPEDTGYSAFQNVLSLLGANQQAQNQSNLITSQQARTFSGQQIGAQDNAYLSQIAAQQAQAQQALDAEKRQAALQLMTLLATPGTKAPDMAALGLA